MEGYFTFQWVWVFFRWGDFIFKWGGGGRVAPLGSIGFYEGGRFRKTLLDGGRPSKINKPENQKMKGTFFRE